MQLGSQQYLYSEYKGLFGIAFLAFAMAFERDKRNNPAERSVTDARPRVTRVVQLEEMNWGPAIPKSKLGAAFTMRFRATVRRINKQGRRIGARAQVRNARPGPLLGLWLCSRPAAASGAGTYVNGRKRGKPGSLR